MGASVTVRSVKEEVHMKVINVFGGPGAGKSTTASGLFYEMKKHWISAEYIQEYAKELVWSNSAHMLSEQNYIFAEQEHRLNRLRQKVDIAIADSPLLLSSFYAPEAYPNSFHQSVFDFFHTYDNLNIFVERSHEYSLQGRIQNEQEADFVAAEMINYLSKNSIPFVSIKASNASPRRLLTWLVEQKVIDIPVGAYHLFEPEGGPEGWLTHQETVREWSTGTPVVRSNLSGVSTVG